MGKPLIPDGKISRAIREGLVLRAQLIRDGMDEVEVDRIVGQGLKGAWRQSTQSDRDEPWHSLCRKCNDSGWLIVEPSYMEKQRLVRMYGPDPQYQSYMQACDPCLWREREREKRRQLAGEFEGLAAAGQTKQPRKYLR